MSEANEMDDTPTIDEGGAFDARAAAALLEQTTRRAQRQFEFPSPLLALTQGVALLAAYGAVWVSVRGQNPYRGPSGTALVELYFFVVVAAVAVALDARRARAGVSARSSRLQWMRAIAFTTAYVSVYTLMGALLHDGFSYALVYGIIPAVGPLILVGAVAAGDAAAREDWKVLAFAIALVAIGVGSAFAGPDGVWGVAGVGICALLVFRALTQIWPLRT
jgi:hypothetical protein